MTSQTSTIRTIHCVGDLSALPRSATSLARLIVPHGFEIEVMRLFIYGPTLGGLPQEPRWDTLRSVMKSLSFYERAAQTIHYLRFSTANEAYLASEWILKVSSHISLEIIR